MFLLLRKEWPARLMLSQSLCWPVFLLIFWLLHCGYPTVYSICLPVHHWLHLDLPVANRITEHSVLYPLCPDISTLLLLWKIKLASKSALRKHKFHTTLSGRTGVLCCRPYHSITDSSQYPYKWHWGLHCRNYALHDIPHGIRNLHNPCLLFPAACAIS